MGFTTLLNAVFGIDKPITSSIGLALRDNPIAIATGDVDAPRVLGRALGNVWLGDIEVNAGTPVVLTGLDRCGVIRADFANVTNDARMYIRYSADGGATWGAVQELYGLGVGFGCWKINLQTGATSYFAFRGGAGGTEPIGTLATHTVPTDCNAIEFSNPGSGNKARMTLYSLGGIE